MSNNDDGLYSYTAATILLAKSVISGNGEVGVDIGFGTVFSYGDNYINGNATDIAPTLGSLTPVSTR